MGRKWALGQMLQREEFDVFIRKTHATFAATNFSPRSASLNPHVLPQVAYVFDEAGRPFLDFIARTETLQQDWQIIRERLNVTADLSTRMKSLHRPYQEYYDEETRGMVAEIYACDIEAFGYHF
jgi:hypothetical protein